MSLNKLKVQNFRIGTFSISQEEFKAELDRYEYLKNKLGILNKNINMLKNNFLKYKNSQEALTKQYNLLKAVENEFYKDIFQVGKTKALGYLPESYFKNTGRDLNYFIEYAINRKLSFHITDAKYTSRIIAVYDKKWIEKLLYANQDILYKNNLPFDADNFVKFITDGKSVDYEDNMELFLLIAMAFNDNRLEKVI